MCKRNHLFIHVSVLMHIYIYMSIYTYTYTWHTSIFQWGRQVVTCDFWPFSQGTELDAAVVLQLLTSEISVRSPTSPAPTVHPPRHIRLVLGRMSLGGLVGTACTILPQDKFPKLMKNELERLRKAIRAFDLDTLGWWGQMSRHPTSYLEMAYLKAIVLHIKNILSWIAFECVVSMFGVAQQHLHINALKCVEHLPF